MLQKDNDNLLKQLEEYKRRFGELNSGFDIKDEVVK